MKPKVSIIVPVYNVELYLNRCVDSLLNQTLREIEIILVDDGSPDGCPEICDDYAKKDSRVKVIHKQNGGLGYARNSGMAIAIGEFIAFVDSDDYVDHAMYETLYNKALSANADVVFCNFYVGERNGSFKLVKEVEEELLLSNKNRDLFLLDMIASAPNVCNERQYQMSVWHAIYLREIIVDNNINFYSEREIVSEDIPFQCQFLLKSNLILYIPSSFYYYCFNNISLTKTFVEEKFSRFIVLYKLLLDITRILPNSERRCSRLFIGYSRSYIRNLVGSKLPFKRKVSILEALVTNQIWEKIGLNYEANNFVTYQRIFYSLIMRRDVFMLYFYVKITNRLRK